MNRDGNGTYDDSGDHDITGSGDERRQQRLRCMKRRSLYWQRRLHLDPYRVTYMYTFTCTMLHVQISKIMQLHIDT